MKMPFEAYFSSYKQFNFALEVHILINIESLKPFSLSHSLHVSRSKILKTNTK